MGGGLTADYETGIDLYQRSGVNLAIQRNGQALIVDEMVFVKTAQCIASMFECIVEGRLRGEGIWRLNMVFDNEVELHCDACPVLNLVLYLCLLL